MFIIFRIEIQQEYQPLQFLVIFNSSLHSKYSIETDFEIRANEEKIFINKNLVQT